MGYIIVCSNQENNPITKDIAMLQRILHHSHPSITLHYIGITEEETHNVSKPRRSRTNVL
ncbi:hypothetical protein ACFTQL_18220 [Peribacillus butanolivorans]|uniref:hypothetical protein n=1 Tax=Peribacillus butanolivorans TaxID=421767 RepID=UPI0036298C07